MCWRVARTIATFAFVAAIALQANVHAQTNKLLEKPADAPVIVQVDNGNWLDMRVYTVRNGNIYDRIGTVRSFSSREFELPRWINAPNSQVQLVVVPIGSRQRYAAPPVLVSAGDVIEWKLASNLALSTISVRAG